MAHSSPVSPCMGTGYLKETNEIIPTIQKYPIYARMLTLNARKIDYLFYPVNTVLTNHAMHSKSDSVTASMFVNYSQRLVVLYIQIILSLNICIHVQTGIGISSKHMGLIHKGKGPQSSHNHSICGIHVTER